MRHSISNCVGKDGIYLHLCFQDKTLVFWNHTSAYLHVVILTVLYRTEDLGPSEI